MELDREINNVMQTNYHLKLIYYYTKNEVIQNLLFTAQYFAHI